jgi:hypothetical protein
MPTDQGSSIRKIESDFTVTLFDKLPYLILRRAAIFSRPIQEPFPPHATFRKPASGKQGLGRGKNCA